MQTKNKNKVV